MRVVCCCCGKQAVSWAPSRSDRFITTLVGARSGVRAGESFCGYCAEGMDKNGFFPEEAAADESLSLKGGA
jgi:hypothetical protein